MRVCLVFFVCTVLVASAIARPGSRVNRQKRNHRTFEDGLDARKSKDESDTTFLDDSFNERPIPLDSGRFGKVKNVYKSAESDEQDQSESSESDESRSGEHDSYYADNYFKKDFEDGQSEEDDDDSRVIKTSKYDDSEYDDSDISRAENDDRRPPPTLYGSRAQKPRRYDDNDNDVDNDIDIFRAENDNRRPPPTLYGSKAQEPRRYDDIDNDIDIFGAENENRKPQTPVHFPKAQEHRRYDDIDNDIDIFRAKNENRRPQTPVHFPKAQVPRKYDDTFLEDRSYDEVIGGKNHGLRTQHQETQKSLSDYCDDYCSGEKIRHGGAVDAEIRSMCGCDDYEMQYKK